MSLDDGTYTIKMEISPTYKTRRQFRVLDHKKKTLKGEPAAILIHAGNYPGDVEGCIAPGTITLSDGVDNSNLAMEQIFQKFGGFKEGEEGTLVITTKQGG